jgi:hypothetical protein
VFRFSRVCQINGEVAKMGTWKVTWGEQEDEKEVRSLAELDEILQELSKSYGGDNAILAELESPDGSSLAIGLGRSESVLNYVSPSGDPPYYSSVGVKAESDDEDVVVFFFRGAWSEFPRRHLVPIAVARKAARYFFTHQGLFEGIEWEED